MWGQSWGQMIWGRTPAVPALGAWGAILLGAVLLAFGIRRLRGPRPRVLGALALALAILLPLSARALPFTFTNGTVADATQVNANFAALANQQGVAPAASSALIDLTGSSTATCPGGPLATLRILPDGNFANFAVAPGQTFVVTEINVGLAFGPSFANHTMAVEVGRTPVDASGNGQFGTIVEQRAITLDGRGAGNLAWTYGAGSAYGPNTAVCVNVFDQNLGARLTSNGVVFVHGFLTTQ
jgi:hypothetical protein